MQVLPYGNILPPFSPLLTSNLLTLSIPHLKKSFHQKVVEQWHRCSESLQYLHVWRYSKPKWTWCQVMFFDFEVHSAQNRALSNFKNLFQSTFFCVYYFKILSSFGKAIFFIHICSFPNLRKKIPTPEGSLKELYETTMIVTVVEVTWQISHYRFFFFLIFKNSFLEEQHLMVLF